MTTAVLFQSFPPLAPDEYAALEASIREHGVQVPIVVDENGVVIDGHHRQTIAASLGVHCPRTRVFDKTDTEKRTLALTLNLDRRNLSREQRRAIVEASVKADPQLSNREHARRTGVDDKTVGAARDRLEARAEIPHVSERTDSLGRQQPATKPEPEFTSATEALTDLRGDPDEAAALAAYGDLSEDEIEELLETARADGDLSREHLADLARAASDGGDLDGDANDGKSYPKSKPRSERRKPLPTALDDAAYKLSKAVTTITNLSQDDRFGKHKGEALRFRNDLARSVDALHRVLDLFD